jgi:hypothetical protein
MESPPQGWWKPLAFRRVPECGNMVVCQAAAVGRTAGMSSRAIWPGSRGSRKAVLVGPMALRVRDLLHETGMERTLTIVSGKVARTMSTS